MFYRKLLDKLDEWQKKNDRKPLILRGARQVGKTTAVDMFSQSFENYIKLNLELFKDREIFKDQYSIKELFQAILVTKNVTLTPGKILIFIDEIQNSPTAIKMLRYFYEEMKDLYIIAAGSLLEIYLEKEDLSFPVGRVEYLYMYPLTFEEFLVAKNQEKLVQEYNSIPLKIYAHPKLLELFYQFTLVGGMPEIVQKNINNENLPNLSSVYESILTSYLDDSEKYARNPTMRYLLRHCIEAIPSETGKRIKFQGFGNSNYRSREVGEALKLIERAMLIYLIYPSTSTSTPLSLNFKKSPKLQFVDTGILNYAAGIQHEYYRYHDLHSIYRGVIAEHIVRQELIASHLESNKKPAFWTRERSQSNAEVDILYQKDNYLIPVEVKSGKSGSLKSLQQYMNQCDHSFAVRLYGDKLDFHKVETANNKAYHLLNLPYYLAGKLDEYLTVYFKE